MEISRNTQVQIAANENKKLSKEQQTFNRLIKNIRQERACLQEWQAIIPLYQAKKMSNLYPLVEKHTDYVAEMLLKLDLTYNTAKLGKREKQKLSIVILDMAEELVCSTNREDVKEIYNAHSRSDFDAEDAMHKERVKSMLEDEFGFDFGEDEDIDVDEAERKLEELLQEQAEREAERQRTRKKTAKMLEKEAKQEEEASKLKQPLKEIYRKLAQELHPDREQDEVERLRKHEMMQRANIAYKAKNLLELLELQFEIEQSSQAEISATSTDRLKSYNKILQEQLWSIKAEVDHARHPFVVECASASPWGKAPAPENILGILEVKIKQVERGIEQIQQDLESFDNPKNVKEWLKEIKVFH